MERLSCRIPARVRTLLTDFTPRDQELINWTQPEPDPGIGDEISLRVGGAGVLTSASSPPKLCGLCLSRPSRYTCPRCNIPYCTLECYRRPDHSGCAEEFYRECVSEELKSQGKTEEEGRLKMQEILLRLRSSDRGMETVLRQLLEDSRAGLTEQDPQALELLSRLAESEACGMEKQTEDILQDLRQMNVKEKDQGHKDLAEKLSGLNIDALTEEQLWNLLPSWDQQKFEELLKGGGVGGLVVLWSPWWEEHEASAAALIEELHSGEKLEIKSDGRTDDPTEIRSIADVPLSLQDVSQKPLNSKRSSANRSRSAVPLISAKIPPLHTISSSPSPLVQFSVVNTVFGYAFSLCLFNGDVSETEQLLEFCRVVLDISESLGSGRVFPSLSETLEGTILAVSGSGHLDRDDPDAPVRALEATAHILTGQSKCDPTGYVLSALSQLRTAFCRARTCTKGQKRGEDWRQKFFLAGKKCQFFQSWVKENDAAVRSLAWQTWMEYSRKREDREMMERDKKRLEEGLRKGRGKVLIEEI